MFDQQYPHLTSWIPGGDGWIEMGQDEFSRSLVCILDFGGMIWESDQRCATIDQTLAAAEQALAEWGAAGGAAGRGNKGAAANERHVADDRGDRKLGSVLRVSRRIVAQTLPSA